jgi:hypothetical protein
LPAARPDYWRSAGESKRTSCSFPWCGSRAEPLSSSDSYRIRSDDGFVVRRFATARVLCGRRRSIDDAVVAATSDRRRPIDLDSAASSWNVLDRSVPFSKGLAWHGVASNAAELFCASLSPLECPRGRSRATRSFVHR